MKFWNRVFICALILFISALSGCATVPEGSQRLQKEAAEMVSPNGKAGVYYFMPSYLAHAYLTLVTIDSQLFGYVSPGSYLYGAISSGKHSLTAGDYYGHTPWSSPPKYLPKHIPRSPRIEFTAREGENYFFRAYLGFPGIKIKEIDVVEARGLINDLTLSAYSSFEPSSSSLDDGTVLHEDAYGMPSTEGSMAGCKSVDYICLSRTSLWHTENGKLTNVAWAKGVAEKDNFTFQLNENNDLMIIADDGEIIILSGQAMLVKGVPVEAGYEIDFADAPMFNYLIVTGLLNLAYPKGPSEVVGEHKKKLSEKEKQLRMGTGSAIFNVPAPWVSTVNAVRVDSDTISYEVFLEKEDKELKMAGVWKNMNSRLILENSMSINEWKTYAIGVFTREPGRLDTSGNGKRPIAVLDYGAYPHDFGVDTIGGIRAHIKRKEKATK